MEQNFNGNGYFEYGGVAETERKKRIRMPFGAMIACVLVLAIVIGGAFAVGNYIGRGGLFALHSDKVENNGEISVQGSASVPGGSPSEELSYASSSASPANGYSTIESAMNAVVSIDVMTRYGYSSVATSSGSGVIVSTDGYIATCNHVIDGAEKIYVYLNDGTSSEARLIGRDSVNDLAVIKIEGSELPHAVFGDSETLKVGEGVFAIGNALGQLSNTYTSGVISGLDRSIKVEGRDMTLLQTDAAVNHGNSGGGLFRHSDGTLVGIVNAKGGGEDIDGLGFAIPSKVVGRIIGDLMDYGFVTGRPYLGVSCETVALSGYGFFTNYHTYPKITQLEQDSPAEKAGLRVGDVILSVNGTSVSDQDALESAISALKIGDTAKLEVLRDRTNIEISIELAERAVPTAR